MLTCISWPASCVAYAREAQGRWHRRPSTHLLGSPRTTAHALAPQAAAGAPKAREAAEASMEHVALTRAAGPAKGRRPATRKKAAVLSQPEVQPLDMLMKPSAPALVQSLKPPP